MEKQASTVTHLPYPPPEILYLRRGTPPSPPLHRSSCRERKRKTHEQAAPWTRTKRIANRGVGRNRMVQKSMPCCSIIVYRSISSPVYRPLRSNAKDCYLSNDKKGEISILRPSLAVRASLRRHPWPRLARHQLRRRLHRLRKMSKVSNKFNLDKYPMWPMTFPSYQIVSQELHYERGVLVALFTQGVELYDAHQQLVTFCTIGRLTSDGIVKCLLRKVAGLIWRVENLVVKYRKVQGKPQTDRVGGG